MASKDRASKKAARARKKAIKNMTMERIMLLLIGLDQMGKSWVESRPAEEFPHAVPETHDKLVIYRNHNAGLPFGALADDQVLTRALPVAVTMLLAADYIYLKSQGTRKFMRAALALAMSGSLSNICDRFFRGYVVDYLCIKEGALGKVVFNLGDVCVITGFCLMCAAEISRKLARS